MKTPQRKPHKVMSIEEMKIKAQKLAGVLPKTHEEQLKDTLKGLK